MSKYIKILILISLITLSFLSVSCCFCLAHAYLINTLLLPNSYYLSPDSLVFLALLAFSLAYTGLDKYYQFNSACDY